MTTEPEQPTTIGLLIEIRDLLKQLAAGSAPDLYCQRWVTDDGVERCPGGKLVSQSYYNGEPKFEQFYHPIPEELHHVSTKGNDVKNHGVYLSETTREAPMRVDAHGVPRAWAGEPLAGVDQDTGEILAPDPGPKPRPAESPEVAAERDFAKVRRQWMAAKTHHHGISSSDVLKRLGIDATKFSSISTQEQLDRADVKLTVSLQPADPDPEVVG